MTIALCTSHLDEDASGGSREDRMQSGRDLAPKLIPASDDFLRECHYQRRLSLSRRGNPRSVKCTHIDIELHRLFGAVNMKELFLVALVDALAASGNVENLIFATYF